MVEEQEVSNGVMMRYARDLIAKLEAGDGAAAADVLDKLTRLRETDLFQEVGRLTRQLHDTLVSFQIDERLPAIAMAEMTDAKDHLNRAIGMSEDAAHRTMASIEKTMPICAGLESRATDLRKTWERFMSRELGIEEFRALTRELGAFLIFSQNESKTIKAGLNDILMAQEYQDLTGQTIRRVIRLVQEVEGSLVDMIKLSGTHHTEAPAGPRQAELPKLQNQDEVDELLSSLGF